MGSDQVTSSRQIPKTSKGGNSTPLHCLALLVRRNVFIRPASAPLLSACTHCPFSGSIFSTTPRPWQAAVGPRSCPSWGRAGSFSLSSQGACSGSTILAASPELAPVPPWLLCSGAQNWTQQCTWCLTGAEERGRLLPSLDCLRPS